MFQCMFLKSGGDIILVLLGASYFLCDLDFKYVINKEKYYLKKILRFTYGNICKYDGRFAGRKCI